MLPSYVQGFGISPGVSATLRVGPHANARAQSTRETRAVRSVWFMTCLLRAPCSFGASNEAPISRPGQVITSERNGGGTPPSGVGRIATLSIDSLKVTVAAKTILESRGACDAV